MNAGERATALDFKTHEVIKMRDFDKAFDKWIAKADLSRSLWVSHHRVAEKLALTPDGQFQYRHERLPASHPYGQLFSLNLSQRKKFSNFLKIEISDRCRGEHNKAPDLPITYSNHSRQISKDTRAIWLADMRKKIHELRNQISTRLVCNSAMFTSL